MSAISIFEAFVAYIPTAPYAPVSLATDQIFTTKGEAEQAAASWNTAPGGGTLPPNLQASVTTLDEYIALAKQDAAAGEPDRR
jgi:hypothetical protein